MSDMLNKRRYPRFKVSDLPILKARIDRYRDKERIITLGQGGCGFYGFNPNWPFNPIRRLYCELEIEGLNESISVESTIVYMKDMMVDGKKIILYGIQFLPFEISRVEQIVETLEYLRQAGKIDLA